MTRRVFVILTDGLRPDAVTSDRMPHLHGLAAAHTSAVHASTVRPSTTLAALATVVTGLSPASHGLVESRLGLALVGQLARLTPLPRTLRRSGIESRIIASALTPLERTVVRALTTAAGVAGFISSGVSAPDVARAALQRADRHRWGVHFVYLNDCDRVGHEHGWMSGEYFAAAARLDAAVGLLAPLALDSLVIVLADHGGGGVTPTSHGEPHPLNDHIPLIFAGQDVVRRRRIERPVSILDVPPTICHWLGVPVPHWYEGRALTEAFVAQPAVPLEA